MEVREQFRRKSEFSTKNAWAKYVQRRWPANTVKGVMSEWGLTDGEARGLIYSQASQATIDKVLKHRNGGWHLAIEVFAAVIGESLDDFIEQEKGRLAVERQSFEDRDRQLRTMARNLDLVRSVGGDGPP